MVSFLAKLAVNVFLEVFLFNPTLLQVSVEVASSVSEFTHFRGYQTAKLWLEYKQASTMNKNLPSVPGLSTLYAAASLLW